MIGSRACAFLCAVALGAGPAACDDGSLVSAEALRVWTGLSAGPDSLYGYAGASYALSGDGDGQGLLARIGLGSGEYQTDAPQSVTVLHYDADLMVGYRRFLGESALTLYGGVDFAEHDNPDTENELRGSKIGGKVQAEAYVPLGEAIYVSAFGNYSSGFDMFNAEAKALYRWNERLAVGPSAAVLGNEDFDQARTGLAAAWRLRRKTEIGMSAGYAWALEDGDSGVYAGVNIYTGF